MRAPAKGCDGGELIADRHEAGHFRLGNLDLFSAPLGEAEVGHVEIGSDWIGNGIHVLSPGRLDAKKRREPDSSRAPLSSRLRRAWSPAGIATLLDAK